MLRSPDFLAPRECLLAPITELDEAAGLLDRAADGLLAGNLALARELLAQADMPAVRAYAASVMGRVSVEIHRYRAVEGIPAAVALPGRAKTRRPKPSDEMVVFARDGYRCRYCGCRVVLSRARAIMMQAVPDVLHWGAADRDKHAAFYALTAVADHLVPHSRGGTSELDNLVTTCQSCNYGKGDWLIEQVGLIDPRTRPPVCDEWDGLTRIMPNTGQASTQPISLINALSSASNINGKTIKHKMSQENWFADLNRCDLQLSTRLLTFLKGCEGLKVTWTLNKVLLVCMSTENTRLAILGIDRTGGVEIPWYIAGHKNVFQPFVFTLAEAIPGASVYETSKMWRLHVDERKANLSELLEASSALRVAIEALHAALNE